MQVLTHPIRINYEYIGLTPYGDAVALMEKTILRAAENEAHIWGLEHPLVYTTGLKTEKEHILDAAIKLTPARRGGSVTLHNPGQLVVYFAFPLAAVNGGLERFVRVLEAALAETLLYYEIPCNFSPGASGIFTQKGKIAFIGLGLKKNFIYHGVSVNIRNDLAEFHAIQSCGLTLPMTRMADLSGAAPSPEHFFKKFSGYLLERLSETEPAAFRDRAEKRHDLYDWKLGFKLGWLYFHERRYWEAHEIWEMFWHEMGPGELRIFFHSMIQVAMAWYKIFTAPNATGALSLLTKALEKLNVVREIQLLANQEAFTAYLEGSRLELINGRTPGVPPVFSWI